MSEVLSPIGLIHGHGDNSIDLIWRDGESHCGYCDLPVELVMIEERVERYVLTRREDEDE